MHGIQTSSPELWFTMALNENAASELPNQRAICMGIWQMQKYGAHFSPDLHLISLLCSPTSALVSQI